MGDEVLRGVTFADGSTGDMRLSGGTITAVGVVGRQPDDDEHDLAGHVLLPAAVEAHAHLDKAFLAERLANPSGDLHGAIAAMIESRALCDVADIVERAERAARLMARNGFRAVRTHADTTLDNRLASVEALAEVRRRVADVIDVEIVALCSWPITGPGGADQRALLRDALAAGADLVGGCPHLDGAGTQAATETFLAIAADHGVGVDLHTDETLDVSCEGLCDLAAAVTATGFDLPVTASHCVSLGMQSRERQRETAQAVAAAGIAVVALPATNLYLQGRDHPQATPRGLTAVRALLDAGVAVTAGGDNLQDPFNPLGRACPFETAALMVLAAHLSPAEAWASVTRHATIALGQPADLIAVPAASLREAIAMGAPDRRVWRASRGSAGARSPQQ